LKQWKSASDFVAALARSRLDNVFNPYSDHCPTHDLADGPMIRRNNLELFLQAALSEGVDDVWVGLELGRQGGRRTGLPLTDEEHLPAVAQYWKIPGVRRATSGRLAKEPTASFVWKAVRSTERRILFWNAFPLQCHQPNGTTNRNHSLEEAQLFQPHLRWVVEQAAPTRIVALGLKAQSALARAGLTSSYVRHPARNGGPTFLANIHG